MRNRSGFSLIELLIASAAGAMVILAGATIFTRIQKSSDTTFAASQAEALLNEVTTLLRHHFSLRVAPSTNPPIIVTYAPANGLSPDLFGSAFYQFNQPIEPFPAA